MVVAEISVESSRNTSPLILLWTDRCLMYLPNPIFFWYASASASFCRRRRRRRSRHHCTGYRQRSQENLHLTVETHESTAHERTTQSFLSKPFPSWRCRSDRDVRRLLRFDDGGTIGGSYGGVTGRLNADVTWLLYGSSSF